MQKTLYIYIYIYMYIYIYIYTIWTFADKTREHKIYEDVDLDLKINKQTLTQS